jgi:hypothetical protein
VALSEIYGTEATARAMEDAFTFQAFSCEYIANVLERRVRLRPEPGALHLTRRQDLLDPDLPEPDLSGYAARTAQTDEDGFQWNWPRQINRLQVQDLFRLRFLAEKANAVFLGGVGLGRRTWPPPWAMPLLRTPTRCSLPAPRA